VSADFQVGDKVRVKQGMGTTTGRPMLAEGEVYTVTGIRDTHGLFGMGLRNGELVVKNDRGEEGGWYAHRFEQAEEREPVKPFPAFVYVTRDECGNLYVEELDEIDEEDREVVGRYYLNAVGSVQAQETFAFTPVI
jgi:hypothetical protein